MTHMFDNSVLAAAIMSGGALLTSFISWMQSRGNTDKLKELHLTLNSRLDELLNLTRESAFNAGKAAGLIAEKAHEELLRMTKESAYEAGKTAGQVSAAEPEKKTET